MLPSASEAILSPHGEAGESTRVSLCTSASDARRWQEFVEVHGEATKYHCWNWKHVIENTFSWPTYYLMAEKSGTVTGILPLAWMKNRIFGNFITSLPFISGGGIVAIDETAEHELLSSAIKFAQELGAEHIELRHRSDRGLQLPVKRNKAIVVVPLDEQEKMFKRLDKKTRNLIRKGTSFGLAASVGGRELLDEFYGVFAENMRDLGTPVYSKRFFAEIFNAFPVETFICVVRRQGLTVAASFLNGYRDVIEYCWAASIRRYLYLKPNMFLTWSAFGAAVTRGYRFFDFGRSTIGTGAYEYKLQWTGAQPLPLYWTYWLRNGGAVPEVDRNNLKYRLAIRAWQRLPLRLTTIIGPKVVRYLP